LCGYKVKTNSYFAGGVVSFWTQERKKHGTCSEPVLDQHGYSMQAQVKLLQALTSAGKFHFHINPF